MTKTKRFPMPGDIVVAIKTDDNLIPVGAEGVIEGVEGHRQIVYHVLFNWCPFPWWDKGVINASGGPERVVRASRLRYRQRRNQDFHYFPHLPDRDAAKIKQHRVLVWEVDLTIAHLPLSFCFG